MVFIEINSVEKFKDENDYDGENMDFSIFLKKSNNTVKIRLNEYIYGALSETIKENYSLELPYGSDNFFFDFSQQNTAMNATQIPGKLCRTEVLPNKTIDDVSIYSFRYRLEHKLFKNYKYSDANTGSFCTTETNNEVCYFLIPIINIHKKPNLFLYALSSNKSDDLILSYKKVKSTDNLTNEINDNYEKTSKGQFIQNMLFINNSELNTFIV